MGGQAAGDLPTENLQPGERSRPDHGFAERGRLAGAATMFIITPIFIITRISVFSSRSERSRPKNRAIRSRVRRP